MPLPEAIFVYMVYSRKDMHTLSEQIKGAWKSWTIWFNTVGLLLLTSALAEPLVLEYLEDNNLMVIILVGNVLLRFKTNTGLEKKNV